MVPGKGQVPYSRLCSCGSFSQSGRVGWRLSGDFTAKAWSVPHWLLSQWQNQWANKEDPLALGKKLMSLPAWAEGRVSHPVSLAESGEDRAHGADHAGGLRCRHQTRENAGRGQPMSLFVALLFQGEQRWGGTPETGFPALDKGYALPKCHLVKAPTPKTSVFGYNWFLLPKQPCSSGTICTDPRLLDSCNGPSPSSNALL